MQIKTFQIVPALPKKLQPLKELAYNLWYTWHPEVCDLFRRLDIRLWEETYHNPVKFLGCIDQERLNEAVRDEGFLSQLKEVYDDFQRYLKEKQIFDYSIKQPVDFTIAYFSAEYGLADAIPNYSGGLGMLSGDHLKSASDLNLPLVGIGLLYQYGYFHQSLNSEGWQQESFEENDFYNMPIILEKDEQGEPRKIKVRMKDRDVFAQIWRVQVGRIPLYLLDTNIADNAPEDRTITSQLYGGDREMRLRQEILLGIGGVRALHALGIEPAVVHMNEGHSAFAGLERIRILMKEKKLQFDEAFEVVYASNVFTTHTPVPAGNDVFESGLLQSYLGDYMKELGKSFNDLLALGRQDPQDSGELFGMTVLAIKLSAQVNGVSKLHSKVSRKLWHKIWKNLPVEDVPIQPLTNGVHVPTWISDDIAALYNRYLGPRWIEDPDNEKVWEGVSRIPDSELWRTHERNRERLVAFCRQRLAEQLRRRKAPLWEIEAAREVLNPQALTIGFARRFATYKRGTLIFRDPERLAQILNNPDRPVQIIIAGKAHPQDQPGKELIKKIIQITRDPRFRYSVIFLEDYDMNIARYLVQGSDVWLNTPRRPLEACGTSGMKAAANGCLNMSVLDGWWDEAYDGENGWAIGNGEEYEDTLYQDEVESRAIYDLLENEIIPLFYDRSRDGLPRKWIQKMKNSMRTICPYFNTHRMLEEYMIRFYVNAAGIWKEMTTDRFKKAKEYASWKKRILQHWERVRVDFVEAENHRDVPVGGSLPVRAVIDLGELHADEVQVQLYYGRLNARGEFIERNVVSMKLVEEDEWGNYHYEAEIPCSKPGRAGFVVRILPHHKLQLNPFSTGKIIWA
jgi:starch phosphorylase